MNCQNGQWTILYIINISQYSYSEREFMPECEKFFNFGFRDTALHAILFFKIRRGNIFGSMKSIDDYQ